jgi:hypothetical protein
MLPYFRQVLFYEMLKDSILEPVVVLIKGQHEMEKLG